LKCCLYERIPVAGHWGRRSQSTRPEDFNSRNVARAENVRREKVNCVTASESGALQKQCSILIRAL
jgi:hypothetical protein